MGWGPDFPENADSRTKAATQKIGAWTPECRRSALIDLCEYGCDYDDDVFTVLINASSPSEKKASLKYRLERNALRATRWREMFSKTKAIDEHALAIRSSSPRSSAYTPANATAEQLAEQIANGDPCMRRMKTDDAKIYAIVNELDHDNATRRFLQIPVIVPLRELLTQAQSCGNCSDDRSDCKSLRSDLAEAEKGLLEFEKLIASDKTRIL